MIDIQKLSEDLTYYRAVNKISLVDLAKELKVSYNTLMKILKNEHVKETTKILVKERFYKMKEEGEK